MSKIFNVFILIAYLFFSCQQEALTSKVGPPSQVLFDSLLQTTNENRYKASNEIQKKEYFESFDRKLESIVDSIGVFVNWRGVVKDISIKEYGKTTILSCEISYKPEEYREITFYPEYQVKTDSIAYDSLYSKLREIPNSSQVFFDGFIVKDFERKIKYKYGDKLLKEVYPKYEFNLLDISTYPRQDTLSSKLQLLVKTNFKVFELLRDKVNKKISEPQWEKQTKELLPKGIEDGLNPEEKLYINRMKQYLFNDFMK